VKHEIAERNFAAVEAEINEERAAALGRAGRKVQVQFERCQQLIAQLDAPEDLPDRHDLLAEYREARDEFEQRRWQLCVHREAIGLNDHRWIDRVYPTPARR
jgi:hypothetical protein